MKRLTLLIGLMITLILPALAQPGFIITPRPPNATEIFQEARDWIEDYSESGDNDAGRAADEKLDEAEEKLDQEIEDGEIGPEEARVLRRLIQQYREDLDKLQQEDLARMFMDHLVTGPPGSPMLNFPGISDDWDSDEWMDDPKVRMHLGLDEEESHRGPSFENRRSPLLSGGRSDLLMTPHRVPTTCGY